MSRAPTPRAADDLPLRGATLVLTRAAGNARSEARRVRRLGGRALLLPGTRIAPPDDPARARTRLHTALRAPVCIFVSPMAVLAAARLEALHPAPRTRVLAVGTSTAHALRRQGIADAETPLRADSEGLLAMPALEPPPSRVGLVGAPGGRSLLPDTLAARGAKVLRAEVYRRLPARLDRRHLDPLRHARGPMYVLVSSVESLLNLTQSLPEALRRRLLHATAVTSSPRIACAARAAGFSRVLCAASAVSADMLDATCSAHASTRPLRR